jgi:hypothetical protein
MLNANGSGFLVVLVLRSVNDIWNKNVVAQLVEALRYKPEGRGFDYGWGYCDFLLT